MLNKVHNSSRLAFVFGLILIFSLYIGQYAISSNVYAVPENDHANNQNDNNNNPNVPITNTPAPTNTNFAITNISANCNGTGQVTFTGTIPSGGIILTLYDQHLGPGNGFVPSDPLIQTTITSGTSPVSYSLDLSGWTGGPHYRVDSNYNTKSESLYCANETPTQTPTPTITNTPTPTPEGPTNTPTPTPEGPTNTPTPTEGITNTPTPGPSNTPTPGPTNTPQPGPTNTPGPGPTATPGPEKKTGEVLGASTLASTGSFENSALSMLFAAGALLFALSVKRYVKEQKG